MLESEVSSDGGMSLEELLMAEVDLVKVDPLYLIEGEFLTIKVKDPFTGIDGLSKLRLNSVQRKLLKRIKEKIRGNKPIRIWVLKARQAGISTLIESIYYAFTSQRGGINSLIIADDIDGSNYLFEMQKLFQDKLDEHLRPVPKYSNEKKLNFKYIHSQILIDTADNIRAGRKYTFQFVHLSEVAFFPRGLEGMMLGLNQAVPRVGMSMIIGETTANGIGGDFYNRWMEAVKGMSEWEAIFIGWWECEEYELQLTNGELYPIDGMKFSSISERDEFLKEEASISEEYELTREQLNWRRWCIVNNCNGDVLSFRQEYPSSWQEAFISKGDLYFNRGGLLKQVEAEPIAIGGIVSIDGGYEFRESSSGLYKIYEFPKPGVRYIIGGDTAEGLVHGDCSVWVVGNVMTNKTVCVYNHRMPPDQFAYDGIMLGNFYNRALIAPENKGYGYSVCQDIFKKYGNIYRNVKTRTGVQEQTSELGFNTNIATRDQMLAQMSEEIRECATDLLDSDLIRQCWTFVMKDGKAEAQSGEKDDLVIARAIYGLVRSQNPYTRMRSIDVERRKYYRDAVLPNQGLRFKGE